MKTINQLVITVGILLCSLAVWADDAAEKASLETYFSSRGTNYKDVIALAEANQALCDSANTLYKNSFAVIDTVGGEYIFQGFITLDGQKPELPKVDTLYISEEAAAYLGMGAMTVQTTFMALKGNMTSELKKCLGTEAPRRMPIDIQPADPIFGELPCRVEGINYALLGGMTYAIQKLMRGGDKEITKCMLNSDIYFKSAAKSIEAFQVTNIYKKAKAKPLIYEVPLAKAKRLEFLSRDTLDYLHFTSLKEGDTVQLKMFGSPDAIEVEYSKDNRKSWNNLLIGTPIDFDNVGDTIWFRAGKDGVAGTNATISKSVGEYYYFAFGANDSIAAGGNTMSLLDATCELQTMPIAGFACLFYGATQLISAPELPATTLANSCYNSMFQNSGLVVAPELPATILARDCYYSMFSSCANLETAPNSLPADSLAMSCYMTMFKNCAKLKNAPVMKIKVLGRSCFQSMFQGCTSLQVDTIDGNCDGAELTIPTTSAITWNTDMFKGCHEYATTQLGGHYCIKEWEGPRAITFQSIDSTRAYDATSLVADSVMISDPKFDRSLIAFDVFGSQKEVGESENEFTYIWNTPEKAQDYAVDTVYGKLKVDYISTTPVKVTIANKEKLYDGMPLEAEYTGTGVIEDDSIALTLDTTTLTDAGVIGVRVADIAIMRGDKNVTNGYIIAPIFPGSLKINPRDITFTSADDSKLFDGDPLTNANVAVSGDGFIGAENVTFTVTGTRTKVGTSDNTFTYEWNSNTKAANYKVTKVLGKLVVYTPVKAEAIAMYDNWNIVLDRATLQDTLRAFAINDTIRPMDVTWYKVVGTPDKINDATGAVVDDQMANPATGLFHTEDALMNGDYYAVVYVAGASAVMGINYFQSNVVKMDVQNAPAHILDKYQTTTPNKQIINGNLIIIKDGVQYNAQGARL